MATSTDEVILEGFLCPICKADLKSASQLTNHFESLHQEDQDVLRALKDIFGKAKKIILNDTDSELKETFDKALKNTTDHYYYSFEEQVVGASRSHSDFFNRVRSSRLERYAAETNKLLIRLDKLVSKMPIEPNQRKQHEQEVVPWLDETLVNLCPICAKTFNFTRRKHHCRLCGSILCHDCSLFLNINIAKSIVDPSITMMTSEVQEQSNSLRLCEHCYKLIELRKQIQESRNAKTTLAIAYEQMRSLMEQAEPAVAMYDKMCQSLFDGETTYNLSDVNAMRGKIGKLAEGIDACSKQVCSLPTEAGTRPAKLHAAIRQAATHYIKEKLLSLRKLPSEEEIEEFRKKRFRIAIEKVTRERELIDLERVEEEPGGTRASRVENIEHDENNPLLEQMNIIRGYIKKAREELKFDEVATLEQNLKELKKEYHFQLLSNRS